MIPVHDESSDQGIAYYMRLLHEQDKLLKLLEANNISCVILKGCTAAMYYPKPYLRSMGDVDFLVRQDQFDDAIGLMESNGYVCIEGKGEDGRLKKGDRHLGYSKNGIEFELHHHFSSAGFDIDDILEKAIDKREFYTCFQEYGMDTWKLSKKYPVLKPFAFIYGVFRIVVRGIVSIIKTGEFKEQIRYVKDNNKYDRELGIRTKDNKQ